MIGNLRRSIFRKAGRDVDELKQLEAVEPPLCLGNAADLIEIAFLERQLAANDVFVDRDIAFDADRAEHCLRSDIRGDDDLHAHVGRARALEHAHAAVWKSVIPQLGNRHVVRRAGSNADPGACRAQSAAAGGDDRGDPRERGRTRRRRRSR